MDFFNNIDKYSEQIALITDDAQSVCYKDLINAADSLKNEVGRRNLIFVLCDNDVESIIGYIGLLRAESVPVLLNSNINGDFFDRLLKRYKPKFVWLPKDRANLIGKSELVYSYKNYVLFKNDISIDYTLYANLALLLTTSGSTGSPKLVRLSYENLISNAASIAEYLNITQLDRPITSLPMSYTFGLSILNSHFLKGCTVVLTNKTLMDRNFWKLIKEHEVTSFSGVPYIFEMLKKLRFARMDIPSLKTLTQAGGRLGKDLSLEFANICHDKGIRFFVMYGQTEATARMSYLAPEYAVKKAGSVGIPIPGGKFWLEDENGRYINQSETVGELIYQGDNVSMGYAESCKDLSKGDDNGGILKTGDLAKIDEDGFYYIVGRKKRFLKLFGNRVNLDEVEQILKSEGYDCACTGRDDEMKIFITNDGDNGKITKFISNHTGINPAGFKVEVINSIPRNEVGKTLYNLLEEK